ncbi:MAG: N-acetylmuramic acid 6-phosphate etherase [Woeseia sp.]
MQNELTTEARNPASTELDKLSSIEFVRLMNNEDAKLATAVAEQAAVIAAAIDLIAARLAAGGRLVYTGAGTSGRLGVLDASECPPTFNADPEQVLALIAGGDEAVYRAVEGAEDSREQGAEDLRAINFTASDVLVGIAASGHTPYVLGGLQYARQIGAGTVGFSCNAGSPVVAEADIGIAVTVGPEVLSGSTRLKAGTATKMVLNMLTTGAMVKLGKTYGNLMVDLQASNQKLIERSVRIVQQLTDLSDSDARELLKACDGELKTAIVCQRLGITPESARARLAKTGGRLRAALEEHD